MVNTIAIFFNVIDWIYFQFTLRRTSVEFFSLLSLGDDMKNIVPVILLDYWYIVIIAFSFAFLLFVFYNKIKLVKQYNKNYLINGLVILLIIFLSVVAARGGLQYKPIKALAAAKYTNSHNAPLILNTPFTIVTNTNKEIIDKRFAVINLSDYQSDKFKYSKILKPDSSFQGSNVIIFILESFSQEYIGFYDSSSNYTPFLDSILQDSWVFTNSFANAKKSIDALPAILSSIPSLMSDPFISSAYNSNSVPSLSKYLKSKNYTGSFYHGGNNGTMGFDAYTSLCGIDNYYGRNEYTGKPEDYDGQWGIYDEPFLTYFYNGLNQTKQPFFSCFFSLSSHHPFNLPEQYATAFNEGTLPIHKCIGYTDNALKQFFEMAKTQDWFSNTLFVFTADHTGPASSSSYLTDQNRYSIPLAYYYPGKIRPKKDDRITQHIDIMPTILNLLNYDKSIYSFGVSKLDSSNANFAVSYTNSIYQLITEHETLEYDGINYLNKVKNNENAILNEAIIANYNYRMINNKLDNE